MNYTKEFSEKCTVPEILLQLPWTDHSWHNNVSPSFHNERLMVVVWVDFDDVKDREYDTDKRLIVQELIPRENDEPDIGDTLFETDIEDNLKHWLILYEAHMHTEGALTAINNGVYVKKSVTDTLQTALDLINEQLQHLSDTKKTADNRLFLGIWGDGYESNPGYETATAEHGINFFTADTGYSLTDINHINNLHIGGSWCDHDHDHPEFHVIVRIH